MKKYLKILIVDDNQLCLQAMKYLVMGRYATKVELFDSSEEALTHLYDLGMDFEPDGYDLVLMDLDMPVLSGKILVKIIRKTTTATEKTPIIAMTALKKETDADHFEGLATDEVMEKPLSIEKIDYLMKKYVPNYQHYLYED